MTLAERVAAVLGPVVRTSTSYDEVTVDVPREKWVQAVTACRDELGLTYFDLLTAVDEQEAGFDVVLRLWSVDRREGLLLRTRCPRDEPTVPSLSDVFGGTAWHERETAELFGIRFDGHPGLAPLLLPDGFDGHPLRKDFLLAARQDKPWPGAKEPGESDQDLKDLENAPVRRKNLPLGVPLPGKRP